MNTEIFNQLHQLKLNGMAEDFERQINSQSILDLPFSTRLLSMLNAEATYKRNRRLQLLLKNAHLKELGSIHEINYSINRNLNPDLMLALTSLDWIKQHKNICFTGPAGIGKTWLACALGHEACLNGIPVLFKKVRVFLEELHAAKMVGRFHKMLIQLNKYALLILDDWAIEPLSAQELGDLFELIDERHLRLSTIITSQIPINEWHDAFPNKNLADSMLDRLLSTSYRIELKGDSLRSRLKND